MKVALVHDYLKEMGGAEEVLFVLKEMFPRAPVYTAFSLSNYWGELGEEMKKWDIRQSWARYLPFVPKLMTYYTILSPWFFKSLDLSEFDLVIVSATGAYFPNGVKVGKNTKLITYCHTPPRFLYGYPTASRMREKWYIKPIDMIINHFLRMIDFGLAQKPDLFIANSLEVKKRIAKFYRREAEVVYPPVEISSEYSVLSTKERSDYYLMVTRIVGSKNVELAVRAARKYGFKLIVAGRKINKQIDLSGSIYVGEVDQKTKEKLIAGARGVLCLEENADFGIVAVEPQMLGVPVIAFRGGGYLESVLENVTGVFVNRLTEEDVFKAVWQVENIKWDKRAIIKHAKGFSKDNFIKQISKLCKIK